MIKCENDVVEIKGLLIDVGVELAEIVNALEERLIDNGFSKEDADEKIKDSVRIGLMTKEELHAESEKTKEELMKRLTNIIFGGLFK